MHFGKVKDSDQGSLTAKAFADRGQTAVVEFVPVIDDEQALAERLYIVHVVRGNQDGHTSFGIDTQQKLANNLKKNRVEMWMCLSKPTARNQHIHKNHR
jgi:hypothetical protein